MYDPYLCLFFFNAYLLKKKRQENPQVWSFFALVVGLILPIGRRRTYSAAVVVGLVLFLPSSLFWYLPYDGSCAALADIFCYVIVVGSVLPFSSDRRTCCSVVVRYAVVLLLSLGLLWLCRRTCSCFCRQFVVFSFFFLVSSPKFWCSVC